MASFHREKTKMRHAKRRNDIKIKVSNGVFSHGVFSSFRAKISSFRGAGFVFSSFRMALFRLFAWRFFVRLFAWRLFISSRGVFSARKEEKTKWNKPATILKSKMVFAACSLILKWGHLCLIDFL